ncbi:MAG TPA: RNA 2',3'-cyclic phosphodiesterase [Solirubrobacteraceae bacterium]|nr:RNA 2',3'-cyclic phosphodiesterase [Solirubrobacteraceae bacterium]
MNASARGRARLFAALDLPAPVRAELAEWGERAFASCGWLRLLAPEHLHVTLCFLGWRAEEEIDAIGALTIAALREPVAGLALGPAVWLPRRRPRVLAVELVDSESALATLQRGLSDVLAQRAGFEPESRPFLPHVTVARVRERPRGVDDRPVPPRAIVFRGTEVGLYRSHLGPRGARYERLVQATL